MSQRTQKVIISNEARVLRQMRLAKGLSMRAAGMAIGRSDSYISQIENGRMDVPSVEMLEKLVILYGPIKIASFKERVRVFKIALTYREEAHELIKKLSEQQAKTTVAFLLSILR